MLRRRGRRCGIERCEGRGWHRAALTSAIRGRAFAWHASVWHSSQGLPSRVATGFVIRDERNRSGGRAPRALSAHPPQAGPPFRARHARFVTFLARTIVNPTSLRVGSRSGAHIRSRRPPQCPLRHLVAPEIFHPVSADRGSTQLSRPAWLTTVAIVARMEHAVLSAPLAGAASLAAAGSAASRHGNGAVGAVRPSRVTA